MNFTEINSCAYLADMYGVHIKPAKLRNPPILYVSLLKDEIVLHHSNDKLSYIITILNAQKST